MVHDVERKGSCMMENDAQKNVLQQGSLLFDTGGILDIRVEIICGVWDKVFVSHYI